MLFGFAGLLLGGDTLLTKALEELIYGDIIRAKRWISRVSLEIVIALPESGIAENTSHMHAKHTLGGG